MKKLLFVLALIAAGAFLLPLFPSQAQHGPTVHVAKFIKAKRPVNKNTLSF